jgi:hypothetical protein
MSNGFPPFFTRKDKDPLRRLLAFFKVGQSDIIFLFGPAHPDYPGFYDDTKAAIRDLMGKG